MGADKNGNVTMGDFVLYFNDKLGGQGRGLGGV